MPRTIFGFHKRKSFMPKRRKRKKRRGPKITKLLKDKTNAALRYVSTVSLDAGSAAIIASDFSANGCHAPEVTGGHQPLLWDEYKELYGMYRVLSSKIKVTPVVTTTGAVVPCLYGVFLEADGTLDYSLGTSIIEDKRNRGSWGIYAGGNIYNGSQPKSKTASFNAKSFLNHEGATNSVLVTANPNTTQGFDAYYQLWSASIAGNNPGVVTFLVQIDYVIEFSEPKEITPS